MLGASGHYPITVAELEPYTEVADRLFTEEEHDRLKEQLAFWPDAGDLIAGGGGVRKLLWPYKGRGRRKREAMILYLFRDLNMPLYIIAAFADGECELDDDFRNEIAALVAELIEEHAEQWAAKWTKPDSSA